MAAIDRHIADIEAMFGHNFENKIFCAEALQMMAPAIVLDIGEKACHVKKNVKLAVLGDAALSFVLCRMWDEHRDATGCPLSPGQWTSIRNDMLGNANLARLGLELGVNRYILTLASASESMVATTFEAVVGAICRDVGDDALPVVRALVERLGLNNHSLLLRPSMGDSRNVDKNVFGVIDRKGLIPSH